MAQTAGLRAVSLGASALVLSAALIGIASIKSEIWMPPMVDPVAIEGIIERPKPPEPPPPVERPIERIVEPTQPVAQDLQYVPDNVALEPVFSDNATNPQPPQPITITSPTWTQRPSNLARYYPPRALSRGIEGAVLLDCLVSVEGALRCTPIAENPDGWGFAEAALRISRDYRMVPATRDGAPVEAHYRMRVPFNLD